MARYDQIERPTEGIRIARAEDGSLEVPPDPARTQGSVPSDPASAPTGASSARCAGSVEAIVKHMD